MVELDKGQDTFGEVPTEIGAVLEEYKEPSELLKKLPPRREVDHKIELEPGARLPAMAPYRMASPELEEFIKVFY